MAKKHPHPLDGARNAAMDTIGKIADRAVNLYATHEVRIERINVLMDLMAVHFDVQKLRLDDLLTADDFNFMHDISGINHHLDRDNYRLMDHFSPRFSQRSVAA